MRKTFILIFALLSDFCCLFSQSDIHGRVVDFETGQPVDSVMIYFDYDDSEHDNRNTDFNWAKTDRSGEFRGRFTFGENRSFQLSFCKPNYETSYKRSDIKTWRPEETIQLKKLDEKIIKLKGRVLDRNNYKKNVSGFNINCLQCLPYSQMIKADNLGYFDLNLDRNKLNAGDILELNFINTEKKNKYENLNTNVVIPKLGRIPNIYVPYKRFYRKGWYWFTGICTVAFSGSAIYCNIQRNMKYNEYLINSSDLSQRNSRYNEANNWNKGTIISTGLAAISGITFTILLTKDSN